MQDWVDLSGDDGSREAPARLGALHGCGHYHVDHHKVDGAWHVAAQMRYRTRLDIMG